MQQDLKHRKTKHFQIVVSFSHSDPSSPVRRVASTLTLQYESWPGNSATIAGCVWAMGQRHRIFKADCDPQIESILIYPLFVMPLPQGGFDYQPQRQRELFRWTAGTTEKSLEEMLNDLTQIENRKTGTGMVFLPIAAS